MERERADVVSRTWTRCAVEPSVPERRNDILNAMFAAGALAVQEEADSLVTHVSSGHAVELVMMRVREADPFARTAVAEVPAVDWSTAWRNSVRAHVVGSLTIAPPWLASAADPATTIVIEPAMAFGTGDHATTRGVLQLMQGEVRAGDFVADLGCGSAVLAIAAARLGAHRVVAIESDADAIGNAEDNVARNGVGACGMCCDSIVDWLNRLGRVVSCR